MGAATRGHLTLSGAPLDEMGAVLSLYQKIGGQYTRKSGSLVADSKNVQHAVPYVETEEYPGFPTDLQSLYLAAAMTLEGKSCICENVIEDRLRTAEELQKKWAVRCRSAEMADGRKKPSARCRSCFPGSSGRRGTRIGGACRRRIFHNPADRTD